MLYMTFQHKAESKKNILYSDIYANVWYINLCPGEKLLYFLGADKHHENEYELQSVQCTHIPKIEKKRISVYIFVVYLWSFYILYAPKICKALFNTSFFTIFIWFYVLRVKL